MPNLPSISQRLFFSQIDKEKRFIFVQKETEYFEFISFAV